MYTAIKFTRTVMYIAIESTGLYICIASGSTRIASSCIRRRRGYEEIQSGSSSSSSSSSLTSDEEERDALRKQEERDIRQKLKFHFMNPFQKWKYSRRRRFPFKLVLQLITVILVTAQVSTAAC